MYVQNQLIEVKQEHVERAVRLEQIARALSRAGGALSLRQIAIRVGMAKSKHVLDLVGELVENNVVSWEWGKTHNGLPVRLFKYEGDNDNG
jgi:hypothetical protein